MEKRCFFAGHSVVCDTEEIYNKLMIIIEKLIIEENVKEFIVGNYGAFDLLCAKAVYILRKKHPEITLNLLVPYLTNKINKFKDDYREYNNIIIATIPENTPKRLQILKCNEYGVRISKYIVCYVRNTWGGAYKTFEYARKQKHIKMVNI